MGREGNTKVFAALEITDGILGGSNVAWGGCGLVPSKHVSDGA